MKIYNTLSRKKEEFKPIKKGVVKMYTCGPTVYDFAHIGNLRAYIFVDVLKRWLMQCGYKVKHVMNITDVGHLTSDSDTGEDKMEKGARREGLSAWDIASKYTSAFFNDSKKLNIIKPNIIAKATDHIKEQIDFIKKLEKKGFTYIIDDGVYFDTSMLKEYGKLAKLDIKGLKAGARIERVSGKKNDTDFALWKFSPKNKKRDMEWDSPWGRGFPGWHIECSAMSMKYLGDTFDIHTGGVDHISVHHTNEIAQSEALTGKSFVKYWLHSEFLLINKGKMSKSLKNLYTIDDIYTKYGVEPLAFRMFCLGSHYRDKLNFTERSIKDAQNTLDHLRAFVLRLLVINKEEGEDRTKKEIDKARKGFDNALSDDILMPKALSNIFELIKAVNKISDLNTKEAKEVYEFLIKADKILGLELDEIKVHKIPAEVQKLAVEREDARKNGDYNKADNIRIKIEKLGFSIEDTEDGPLLNKEEK